VYEGCWDCCVFFVFFTDGAVVVTVGFKSYGVLWE
jgi:hypothetical protein